MNANGKETGYDPAYDNGKVEFSPERGVAAEYDVQEGGQRPLARNLKSRHMQMIAIGTLEQILHAIKGVVTN